jgi:hypothetical protein
MIVKRLVLLAVLLALVGCGSRNYDDPIKVTSQFNPDAAYATFKTWNFSANWKPPEDGVLSDASFRLELANMVEDALKQYDLIRVFENPDLEIGFYVAADYITDDELQDWYDSGEWNMPSYRGAQQSSWQKGSLILLAFEAGTGQMIWRSSAEAIVDQSVPDDQRRDLVRRAIKLMLEELPKEKQE